MSSNVGNVAPKRAKIGDVIEVPTANGLAYAQYTHKHPKFGALIRVLPGFFAARPVDLTALVEGPDRYAVFLFLPQAVREGEVTIVGHASVPERNRPFPLFRNQGGLPDPVTGKTHGPWWLWDGNREWRVGPLTEAMRDLPLREIWDATMLIHKLVAGWELRDEGVDPSAPPLPQTASIPQIPASTVPSQDTFTDDGSDQDDEDDRAEHALLLFLKLSDDTFGQVDEREALFGLEDQLEEAVSSIGGEVDGHEFGAGYCTLFLYGSDADALFECVIPILSRFPMREGSYGVKRYGPPGESAEERVSLAPPAP